jgi:hypothetical protein
VAPAVVVVGLHFQPPYRAVLAGKVDFAVGVVAAVV